MPIRPLALGLLVTSLLQAHDPISTKLTWSREISRIVYKRCASCHREGGSAMSLLTYEAARPWAKAIKDEVLNRRMPPWGAVKGFGDFRNDPSLTQDEITRLAEWVEGGAPEGEPVYMPSLPKRSPAPDSLPGKRVRVIHPPAALLGVRPLAPVSFAQITATLPDGSRVPLLWLRNYRKEWDHTFLYREPIRLPKGTQINAHPAVPLEFVITGR
jgi:mono/diheme cytochrome c family protein